MVSRDIKIEQQIMLLRSLANICSLFFFLEKDVKSLQGGKGKNHCSRWRVSCLRDTGLQARVPVTDHVPPASVVNCCLQREGTGGRCHILKKILRTGNICHVRIIVCVCVQLAVYGAHSKSKREIYLHFRQVLYTSFENNLIHFQCACGLM